MFVDNRNPATGIALLLKYPRNLQAVPFSKCTYESVCSKVPALGVGRGDSARIATVSR